MHAALLLLAVASAASSAPAGDGVVVDGVALGGMGKRAGVREGDVFLAWRRAPGSGGEVRDPWTLARVETEESPLGTIRLEGQRGGRPLVVHIQPGEWEIELRPRLSAEQAACHAEATRENADGSQAEAAAAWERLSRELAALRPRTAAWLAMRSAGAARKAGQAAAATRAFAAARALLAGDPAAEATLLRAEAAELAQANDLPAARAAYQAAQRLEEARDPRGFGLALTLHLLGRLASDTRELDFAQACFDRARAIRRGRAPAGVEVVRTLNGQGILAWQRGDLDAAEGLFGEALAIQSRRGLDDMDTANLVNNRGNVRRDRGDLAGAEADFQDTLRIRQALEPGGFFSGASFLNLSAVASDRGDLEGAEEHARRALAIYERVAPASMSVALVHNNLGVIARDRGDLERAEDFLRRALTMRERLAPGSTFTATSLSNLGGVLQLQGALDEAEALHRRALEIRRALAPGSADEAVSLRSLAALALERGDGPSAVKLLGQALGLYRALSAEGLGTGQTLQRLGEALEAHGDVAGAEQRYRESAAILERLAPESAWLAEAWHGLATVLRRSGRSAEVLGRAMAALEGQRGRLGGTEEARSAFAGRHAELFRDAVDLLVELGRAGDAFATLERSRARRLLEQLAERDIGFRAELPAGLDRERRAVDAAYDRVQADVASLSAAADAARIEALLARMGELRAERARLAARVRAASPRLAALQYPQPLGVGEARRALDPGTLLLAFSVGRERTLLFALAGGEAGELAVFAIPIGERALRERVEALRGLIQARELGALTESSARLYDALLRPAEPLLRSARRLLVSPDGPLHVLPFAALVTSREPLRYLADGQPLHLTLSATLYAELRRGARVSRRGASLVALGDPSLHASPGDAARGAGVVARARALGPLPAAGEELRRVGAAFPGARVLARSGFVEERVAAAVRGARYVHFATHAVLDRRFPLDSALVTSPPARPGAGNGLLQAWEVFGRLRLAAELVTLSACETGLGREFGGEGLVGLARAFHFAGARSVVASLWAVSDRSSAELMARFYRRIRSGEPRVEALRAAQLELRARPATSHPYHWGGVRALRGLALA
jgi:CHAT domain-containing protein